MFSTIFGLVGQPKIPVRIPNDDSTFNPKEYSNVVFKSAGKISGKIRLVHGADGDNDLGLISTRIWVTRESYKDDLSITIDRDNQTHRVFFQVERKLFLVFFFLMVVTLDTEYIVSFSSFTP